MPIRPKRRAAIFLPSLSCSPFGQPRKSSITLETSLRQKLAAVYQISDHLAYIVSHNGLWLLALLWGTLYYRIFNEAELERLCQPPASLAKFVPAPRSAAGLVVTVAGDCTESRIPSFTSLQLSKLVYSDKVEAPTLKVFFLAALNNFVLLHSWTYGGSPTERAPAEAVFTSPDFADLISRSLQWSSYWIEVLEALILSKLIYRKRISGYLSSWTKIRGPLRSYKLLRTRCLRLPFKLLMCWQVQNRLRVCVDLQTPARRSVP